MLCYALIKQEHLVCNHAPKGALSMTAGSNHLNEAQPVAQAERPGLILASGVLFLFYNYSFRFVLLWNEYVKVAWEWCAQIRNTPYKSIRFGSQA